MQKKPEAILDSDSGRIQIITGFNEKCTFTMNEFLVPLKLQQESIQLFGKIVPQPRLSRFYSDDGVDYTYSNRKFAGISWTKELLELKDLVEDYSYTSFNSALVNYYRNGNDSMGLHADNEPELGFSPIIASMNFGASRKMVFRKNGTKEKLQIILHHGDLLIMSGTLQHNWKHEIPKQRKITTWRLNITFRKINQNAEI